MTVGTVAYAAPEQLMGEAMDGRADQYALAATAYHMLTGLQLFPHSNPAVVISRHLNTTPPTLSDRRPDCAGLDAVLQIALAKNPSDRFPSCSAFAQILADAFSASGAATASATTQAAPKTSKSASTSAARSRARLPGGLPRRTSVVAGSVAVIILVIVVVALGLRFLNAPGNDSAGATSTTASTNAPPPGTSAGPAPASPTLTTTPTTASPTTTAITTPAIATADEGTPVVINCGGQPEVKPQSIILTCADNTWAVDNIVQKTWSAGGGAEGTGIEFLVSCVPNCAQGTPTYSPVSITLTGAVAPTFRYTNAVITNQNTGTSETSPLSRG